MERVESWQTRWRLTLGVILLLALTIRLALIFLFPQADNLTGDSLEFDLLARNLLAGHGLSYKAPWLPSARKTPLYPWLLAQTYRLFGPGHFAPLLTLQAAADTLLAGMLARLARWAWRDRRLGLLAAVMWAAYLPGAQLAARLLADSLFVFLQVTAIFFFIQMVRHFQSRSQAFLYAALAGAFLGLATLTRPTSLYFPLLLGLALAGWRVWSKRVRIEARVRSAQLVSAFLILTLVMVLAVAPWFVRNYRAFGRVVMGSTLVGFNFFQTHFRLDQPDFWRLPGVTPSLQAIHQLADARGLDLNEAELFQLGMAYGLEKVKAYPGRFLALSGLRVLQLWFNLGFTWHPSKSTLLFAAVNLALLVMAFWAEARAWRWRRRLFAVEGGWRGVIHLTAILILLYYTLSHAVVIAAGRYIIPAIPFLIVLAAGAPWRWLRPSRGVEFH
ncbi:MAG TPA: phospholipid carrier-dependent glycosyltransferase [Anaerolineae bacterium]|nr:phospholipid carrier-dependent glycosyltransferase [Anaerolineae bacterium]HIQ11781.1 phospholipid carrier-dependent glycosyltransferase [Caldilineales bacterium]